jgi:acyl-homoserine-lactone acylase
MKKILLLVTIFNILFFNTIGQKSNQKFSVNISTENITIARDKYGVPHIFAKTDPEVGYGLGWANCEDDFETMQELIFAGKGLSGKLLGIEGAKRDFLYFALGMDDIVDKDFDKKTSTEFKRYLEGYVQGVNKYAELHPKEVKAKGVFPLEPKDAIKSYVFALSIISGAHDEVSQIIDGSYEKKPVAMGSNAMAFNSLKTKDGSSILVVNPHQPITGPFSWYEAHLNSEEGLNVLGAMFPGGGLVFLGSNQNLGWAHTWNQLDLIDVFKLEMHPRKKGYYKFDGHWQKLEKSTIKLKVKLNSWLTITVRKKQLWSVYGATFQSKNKKDYFSVKFGANEEIRSSEQWYRMNKAKNFTEFANAVKMNAGPRFNIVYADRYDTIMYICNGMVPRRPQGYEWGGIVPGNTSKTLWNSYHDFHEKPMYINPKCGYLWNTNNSPFNASGKECNLSSKRWDEQGYWSFDPGNNNRAERFMELIAKFDKVDVQDVMKLKFDYTFPSKSRFLDSLHIIQNIDPAKYPDISTLLDRMKKWNKMADRTNKDASLFLISLNYIFQKAKLWDNSFRLGFHLPESLYVEGVRYAKEYLTKHFNSLEVPLGDIQQIRRGNFRIPLDGVADNLSPNYTEEQKDGWYKPWVGDSYVQIAKFSKDKKFPALETLIPYGASNHPDSPHYTDQMELYANHKTKTMSMDKEEVLKSAEKIYHPK